MSADKTILIVDDAEENVLFLSRILGDRGYACRVAGNGTEALAAMREARPDLVLLDIFMPRKSGVTVYQEMKRDPELSAVPIIIITGASEITGVDMETGETRPTETYGDDFARGIGESIQERLRDFEPEGYLEKPIEPEALLERIERVLGG